MSELIVAAMLLGLAIRTMWQISKTKPIYMIISKPLGAGDSHMYKVRNVNSLVPDEDFNGLVWEVYSDEPSIILDVDSLRVGDKIEMV